VLKVELHAHTGDDPIDRLTYTTPQLIDRAADLGYDALAITLHDRQLDLEPFAAQAEARGLVLIPGIERTIQGKHVLLLNFSRAGAEAVTSFDDLARLKQREQGLVVAPHPFFPSATCLRGLMDLHADLFDAVEYNAMFVRGANFNRAAQRWARAHRKPMVGNCDVHRLHQLGTTWSMVDAERNPASICNAIARGHVRLVAQPHSWPGAARLLADILVGGMLPDWSSSRTPELSAS
jgi:predicted metal-dependent phosphoesterase TrpH